jgi:hypothetical protein
VVQHRCLLETLLIPIKRRVGDWMDLRTEKIGGGVLTDSDSSRRWREEERETGLLGGRRDRRKAERRVDNVPTERNG